MLVNIKEALSICVVMTELVLVFTAREKSISAKNY